MNPATAPVVVAESAGMGSEYTDARTYLKQPAKAPRVTTSDETFHGSNDSEFMRTRIGPDE